MIHNCLTKGADSVYEAIVNTMGDIQDLENESYNIEQVNAFIFALQITLTYKLAYARKSQF